MEPTDVPRLRVDARMRRYQGTLLVAGPECTLELSESAAVIVRGIDGTRTVLEISSMLAEKYGVSLEHANSDTVELLDELVDAEIVERA